MSEPKRNTERIRRGRIVERALHLGLRAELTGGRIALSGVTWSWDFEDLALAEACLAGYAAGLADQRETGESRG